MISVKKDYLHIPGSLQSALVRQKALLLTRGYSDGEEIIQKLFLFVRDRIRHSADAGKMELVAQPERALEEGHTICYVKSILLVTMMRYVGIPAGFGYQKLLYDNLNPPCFTLHGYVNVWNPKLDRWIKLDPRGSKEAPNGELFLDRDNLVFEPDLNAGEVDENINHPLPLPSVLEYLKTARTRENERVELPSDFI